MRGVTGAAGACRGRFPPLQLPSTVVEDKEGARVSLLPPRRRAPTRLHPLTS